MTTRDESRPDVPHVPEPGAGGHDAGPESGWKTRLWSAGRAMRTVAADTCRHVRRRTAPVWIEGQRRICLWRLDRQKVVLGERLHAEGLGEQALRERISELDETIRHGKAEKQSVRNEVRSRRALLVQLAESSAETLGGAAEADAKKLQSLRQQLADLESTQRRHGEAPSPSGAERARIAIGYGALLLTVALGFGWWSRGTPNPPTPEVGANDTETDTAPTPQGPADALRRGDVEPSELKPEQIVTRTEKSIALVRGKHGFGTGFLVKDHLLATNAHVIRLEFIDDLKIHFPSAEDDEGPFAADLVYEDAERDLAFLSVDVPQRPLRLADSYSFRRGQVITVIGNPGIGGRLVLQNAVSRGVMSTKTEIDGRKFHQLSISINPGNSGGPVIDSSAAVIGVVTLRAVKEEGLAFCIPLDEVRAAMATIDDRASEDRRNVESRHRLRVAFRFIKDAGDFYASAMRLYAESMAAARGEGKSANYGLRLAKDETRALVAAQDRLLVGGLKRTVSELASNSAVAESTRRKLVDLWTNCSEMKNYVDKPKGTYDSFQKKRIELTDKHNRLAEALGLLLGVTEE